MGGSEPKFHSKIHPIAIIFSKVEELYDTGNIIAKLRNHNFFIFLFLFIFSLITRDTLKIGKTHDGLCTLLITLHKKNTITVDMKTPLHDSHKSLDLHNQLFFENWFAMEVYNFVVITVTVDP